ncbi:MAG: TolC family protein [Acidobacteria bacterium]|jgi:outer membrane protein|nr:TolC family protein [Acidobacteriota bacterium]
MRVRAGVVAAVVALALPAAPEVRGEDVPVTLAEALELAGKANPELQASVARAEAQAARAESVDSMKWPRLGLETGWSASNMPAMVFANKMNAGQFAPEDFDFARLNDPDALSSLNTALTLEVPIDVFGKIGAATEGMSAYGEAASAASRDQRQEIRFQVVEAYRQAELAGRALEVNERALDVAEAREADIEARVDTGAALRADLLRARARRRQREAELAARRGDKAVGEANLARLLGAPPGRTYIPTEGPPAVPPLVGDEAEWVARALDQRPLLEAARQKLAGAGAMTSSEDKSILPDIGAFGSLYDNRIGAGGAQSWAVGVGLRWSIFDSPRSKRKAAALAEQRATEQEVRAAVDGVRFQVAMAYRNALTARERHAAAAGGAEEGREAFRVVQERRKAGMATLTDELETETAALAAILEEIRAAAQVAIADAALERAAGEI